MSLNKTALAMIFKLAEAREKLRRLGGHNLLPKLILRVKFADGIEINASSIHCRLISPVTNI
jgi:putative transposase